MKWYIVIICSEDWYTIFNEAKIIKAANSAEASIKAMEGVSSTYHVETIIECGRTKPKEV